MKFIFDLDGTLTKEETLPLIAKHFGLEEQISELTKNTIQGNVPFVESFIRRVNVLGKYSVAQTAEVVGKCSLSAAIVQFISNNADDCIIATGNLDVWIDTLVSGLGCEVRSSNALVENDRIKKLLSILHKADIVKELQNQGETVVFIGDSNNDAEAMRLADYSIACGLIHWPAISALAVADFVVFDEQPLLRLLNAMTGVSSETTKDTLVLCCAGIGSRLGLDCTKALMSIEGRPYVQWQIGNFHQIEDVRVVVGFQANDVIKSVLEISNDIIFVLNHEYFGTGTGYSLYLGARFSNEYVIAWDGDLLVHHSDLPKCLSSKEEFLGVSEYITDDAVYALLTEDKQYVEGFTREKKSTFEWSGPSRLRRNRILNVRGNVFDGLLGSLPLPAKIIKAFDIDTESDYEKAVSLFRSYKDGK